MAGQVTGETRGRVVELARTGLPRNEVARRAEVSTTTVSRICRAAGITFDRSTTEAATHAKAADARSRRAQLASDLLEDIAHVRAVLRGTDKPQGLMHTSRAVSELVTAHVRLAELDTEDGLEHAKSMLGTIFEGIQAWNARHNAHEDDQP